MRAVSQSHRYSRVDRALQRAKAATGIGSLPDYLVIGGDKCGSTSFYNTLIQHPAVLRAHRKEPVYFSLRYRHSPRWYRAHFPSSLRRSFSPGALTGEASPSYLFHPLAPERAFRTVPRARLVALLRDPVARAYSHFQHARKRGWEPLASFAEALAAEDERAEADLERLRRAPDYRAPNLLLCYRRRGIYVDQLEAWTRFYPREQLLVLRSEDFFREPGAVLRRVQEFLGLPLWDGFRHEALNPGNYSDGPDDAVRRELRAFYAPHDQRLAGFLGEDPGWPQEG